MTIWCESEYIIAVMPGPAAGRFPGIHVLRSVGKHVDGRDTPGHNDVAAGEYLWT